MRTKSIDIKKSNIYKFQYEICEKLCCDSPHFIWDMMQSISSDFESNEIFSFTSVRNSPEDFDKIRTFLQSKNIPFRETVIIER